MALSTRHSWHHLSCRSQQQAVPCPIWRAIPFPQVSLASNLGCSPIPSLGLCDSEVMGPLVAGTERGAEKVGTRNGIKGDILKGCG